MLALLFLGDSADALAGGQDGVDVIRLDAGIGPQHHQVVQQIGGLIRQLPFIATHRLDHRFDRFLTQLLGDLGGTTGKQLGGIGSSWVLPLARDDGFVKAVEDR